MGLAIVLFGLTSSTRSLAQGSGVEQCCDNYHRFARELQHQLLVVCAANGIPAGTYRLEIDRAVKEFIGVMDKHSALGNCGTPDDRVYNLSAPGFRRVRGCVPGHLATKELKSIERNVEATVCKPPDGGAPPITIHEHFYVNEVSEMVEPHDCCCSLPVLIDLPSRDVREIALGVGLLPQIPAAATIGTSALIAARPGAQPLLSAEVPVSMASAGVALGGGVSVSPFRMAREAQLARRAAARIEYQRYLDEAIDLVVESSAAVIADEVASEPKEGARLSGSEGFARSMRAPDARALAKHFEDRGMTVLGPSSAGRSGTAPRGAHASDWLKGELDKQLSVEQGAIWSDLERRFAAELEGKLLERASLEARRAPGPAPAPNPGQDRRDGAGPTASPATHASSTSRDARARARRIVDALGLKNPKSPERVRLRELLLELSDRVVAVVPSRGELARSVALSAWLDGLNVSLAASQPSSRVDQRLGTRAKFAVAMTLDYAGDHEGNRDPAANTELRQCIQKAIAELQEAAQQARQNRGASGDTSLALSAMMRSAEERCYREVLPPASPAMGVGVSPGFYVDGVERIQYDATRLWLTMDWQHDALALTSAFEILHFREPKATYGRVFPQGTMRGTLALRPASIAVELGVGAARMAAGAADEASDVAPRAGLHVGGSGAVLLPVGLSLSASVLGRWSFEDDATEARVITSIGWAEMPDFIRRALEYSGFSARR
ncbi:hypothetical protein [Sorangium sp. So ce341]|uniref:hypothetical protein n=1 Tax=Sorangium sp. So ce341 TaxID=3133302 RepID=UPI003F61C268